MSIGKSLKELNVFMEKDKYILKQVKQDKNIIYGARALEKQVPFARFTRDYDIYSNKPKKSSKKLERTLDKKSSGDYYFSRQSKYHKKTFKVIHKGADMKPETKDDIGIADFSKPDRKVKTVSIDGIKYAKLKEIERDKKQALKSKKFAFRHQKDKRDLDDINRNRLYKKIFG